MKSHKKRVFLSILATSTVFLTPGMAAAAVDEAGANALKTSLTTLLDKQKASMTAQGTTLAQTGEFVVKPMGTYYDVTYPHYVLTIEDMIIDIGQTKSNMMPGTTPTEWKATLALAPQWTISNKTTGEIGKITLGTQKCNYTMDMQYGSIQTGTSGMDCAVDNVVFTPTAGTKQPTTGTAKIGRIAMKSGLTPDANGLYTGPFTYQIQNIVVDGRDTTKNTTGTFKVADISLTGNMTRFNLKKYQENQAAVEKITTELQKSPGSEQDAEKALAMIEPLLNSIAIAEAYDMNAVIKGIDFTGTSPGEKAKSVKIAQVNYGGSASGFNADKQTMNTHFGVTGLNIDADLIPADLKPFVPTDINYSMTFKDLPLQKIFAELLTAMKTEATAQAQSKEKCVGAAKAGCEGMARQRGQKAGQDMIMKLPKMLADAGTLITLENTGVKGAGYDVAANGNFKPGTGAALYGAGALKVIFTGMDTLIPALQSAAQKPDIQTSVAAMMTQAVTGLTMAQMMGQQGTGSGGKPARIYDFTVNDAGNIKLNGADMSGLVPKPTPATPPAQTPSK